MPWSKSYVPCARSVSPRELSTLPGRPTAQSQPPRGDVPNFPQSTRARRRLFGRAAVANPHRARRSQECGSSAALPLAACPGRGRYHMEKCRWDRCFSGSAGASHDATPNCFRVAARAYKFRKCDASQVLTARDRAAYIGGSRCAVRLGCYCAPAKLLTDTRFDTRTRRPISVGSKELRPLPALGERGHPVPGCLTSESEERETWTAESLRAVSRARATCASGGRTRLRRYTFQVNTRYSCERSRG